MKENKNGRYLFLWINTPIFWNPVQGEYWELRKNKKHQCQYLEKLAIQL